MSITTSADPTTAEPSAIPPLRSSWEAISLPSPRNAATAMGVAALVAVIAAILVLAGTPTYESRATLSIDQPRAIQDSADTGIIDKLDRLRFKYAGLADTEPVLAPMANGLDTDVEDLRDATTVIIEGQSLLMYPTAEAASSEAAERRAQALAQAIAAYADEEQADNGIPAPERYRFKVIEDASRADKVAPTSRTTIVAAVLAASIFGGLAYVVLQLATASRRLA